MRPGSENADLHYPSEMVFMKHKKKPFWADILGKNKDPSEIFTTNCAFGAFKVFLLIFHKLKTDVLRVNEW